MESLAETENTTAPSLVTTRRIIVGSVLALLIPLLVFMGIALTVPKRFTRSNTQAVHIGMTRDALHELLGRPKYQNVLRGGVQDEQTFTTNISITFEEQEARGFQDYILEQWTSREMTFCAIINDRDEVVCRYSGSGRRSTIPELFYTSPRVTLPPKDRDVSDNDTSTSANE